MTLLKKLHHDRATGHEALRLAVRERLKKVLGQLVPGSRITVFGSLTRPHRFTETSDIDLALETEPAGTSLYQLTALLAEAMERPVDLILLSECRFRDRIAREGELWMLPA